jgi:hypothetical protein
VTGIITLVVVSHADKSGIETGLRVDADGHAVYRQILPGSYDLLVSQPGVGEAKVAVEISPGENTVRVRLE